jgi:hypothetical protein
LTALGEERKRRDAHHAGRSDGPPPERTVSYYAISLFSSRTFWVNALAFGVAAGPEIVALLSSSDVKALVPARWMPVYGMALAVLNIILRKATVRPVALIAPGDTKPVPVARIGPPDPPVVSD